MARYTQGMMDLGPRSACRGRRCARWSMPAGGALRGPRSGRSADVWALRGTRKRASPAAQTSVWLLWAHDDGGLASGCSAGRRPGGIWGLRTATPWFDSREALAQAVPPISTRRCRTAAQRCAADASAICTRTGEPRWRVPDGLK